MGYKLSKERRRDLDAAIEGMKASRALVEDGIGELNRAIQELVDDFNGTAVERYNQDLEKFGAVVADTAEDARGWHDDHGEAWLDGEKGQVSEEFVSKWEEVRDSLNEPIERVQATEVELDFGSSGEWADEVLETLPTEGE